MSSSSCVVTTLALCAGSLVGCATMDLPHCVSRAELMSVETTTLSVVLGAPAHRFSDSPFVTFYRPSQASPDFTLQLKLEPAPAPWPASLDKTPCKGLDWRTFRVDVSRDEWLDFWSLPESSGFGIGIASLDSIQPLRLDQFAFALIDTETSKALVSFGCYWT
jgi:hypothetical protein